MPAFGNSDANSAARRVCTPNDEGAGPKNKVTTPILTEPGSRAKTETGMISSFAFAVQAAPLQFIQATILLCEGALRLIQIKGLI